MPWENDGGCGEFESCQGGYCKFIGRVGDEECRWFFDHQNTDEDTWTCPGIPWDVCRK